MNLYNIINDIGPTNKDYLNISKNHWNSLLKPLNGLGLLEDYICKICSINDSEALNIDKPCIIVMCADNGVVDQNITQVDSSVTKLVTENFTRNLTSVCCMSKHINGTVVPIDIGINKDIYVSGVVNEKIMYGTNDISLQNAMTKKDCERAILVGINAVKMAKEQGFNIIATGEMGIGNTTVCSALASCILNVSPNITTGKGAGLCNSLLMNKINVVKKAIKTNNPNIYDPIDILYKVGGLDIAGLVGVFLGCSYYKIPVVIDGVITLSACSLAFMLNKNVKDYIIPSHISKEPSCRLLLDFLGMTSFINCNMSLGEGTGAVSAISLLQMASSVYHGLPKFTDMNIDKYREFK